MATDKDLIKERFGANLSRYDKLALVQQEISGRLARMMSQCPREEIGRVLEIGAGTGFLTSRLIKEYPRAKWFINDLVEASEDFLERYAEVADRTYLWGDAETMDLPRDLDLIASASTIQWFHDRKGFIERAAECTRAGGYLLVSSFGPENFREIKILTGEGLKYNTAHELQQAAENAGYTIIESREYTERIFFPSPMEVLHHIRATGVNSISRQRWGHGKLSDFIRNYTQMFRMPEEGVLLTYHPVLILAKKKRLDRTQ